MKKGKFGIVLCFYPIAAFAAVILDSLLICLLFAMAAIFLEKDEWAGRQTLQACMLSVVVFFFNQAVSLVNLVHIPYISAFLSVIATIAFVLVYLAAIVLSLLGLLRVRKEEEANLPLFSELAYHIYGKSKPKPVAPPVQQQYPVAYGVPQQPMQPPQQPYPQQNVYPAAPQYAPPVAVQQPQEPQPLNPQQPPHDLGSNGPAV